MPSSESKPRLAFRVGVTGKRELSPAQEAELRPRLAETLSVIKATLENESTRAQGAYSEESPILWAISPLAEGADRLFAEEALKLGYELQVPLPFLRDEYKKDFHAPDSCPEFDRLVAKATAVFEVEGETDFAGVHLPAAYETVGHLVVDHCDLLIAIWDGEPAKGNGGTAHVMEMARHRGIPVVCFGIGAAADTPLDTDAIIHAVRPPWLAFEELARTTEPGSAGQSRVPGSLEGRAGPVRASKKPGAPDANGSYLETASSKKPMLRTLWSWFFKLMSFGAKLPKVWPESIPPSDLKPRYERMDAIATRLSGLYRGAFLLNYTLGLCAVFFALLGYADEERAKYWLWSELAAILIVAALIVSIHRRRWHFRSVDCRYLTEQFRILCYIDQLGLTAPPLRLSAHQLNSDVQKSWMEWRLRGLLRERPLPQVKLTIAEARRYYEDVVDDLIQDQIVYHARNKETMEKVEKRLDRLGWFFVGVAAAACLLHFHFPPSSQVARWLTLCAAGFPAAASACHAIGSQGEFRRLSARSEAMHSGLKAIRDKMEQLSRSGRLSPATLRQECVALAALMIEEVVDWQILYRKPVPPG